MKAKERFNFFPFKWKYPKWAVKYLGLSNKKKKKEVRVNKNIIDMPKHIIYKAIGHHAPPDPDEEFLKKKREVFRDKLGYVPGHLLPKVCVYMYIYTGVSLCVFLSHIITSSHLHYHYYYYNHHQQDDAAYHEDGDEHGELSESKGEPLTGMQLVMQGAKAGPPLAWQASKTRPRTPPPLEKKSLLSWFSKDPHAFKRTKTWAEHERYTCPPMKLIIPTCCCILCALSLLGFCFLYIFQIVEFSEYGIPI